MRPIHSTTLSLAIMWSMTAYAQPELYFDGTVPVESQGAPLSMAWVGGLNFVHASTMDMNGDGHLDLFLFDRSGQQVITLLNDGLEGQVSYTHTRAYDMLQPWDSLRNWVLLRDYNCDGLEDIFTGGPSSGVAVYRNVGAPGAPAFELVTPQIWYDWVFQSGNTQEVNMWVANIDLPGIADVDGDGDLDILAFGLASTAMSYNRNMSMEWYGNCDSLAFELGNQCWGFFSEDPNDNTVTLDIPCPFNVPNPEIGTGGGHPSEAGSGDRAHLGSTVCPLDLDGDGDMDLLVGDVGYSNLVGLYNGGSVDQAYMTGADIYFPSYDQSVELPLFPGGCYLDLNNDGRRDLLVGANITSQGEARRSVWHYTNSGTDAAPMFNLVEQDLFQSSMIDLGEGASPVFFDHDGDGLMDLVVGNHGYFTSGMGYTSQLALLRNIGTHTEPAFEFITDDYLGLSTSGIATSMHPTFGDLDGDGDMDLYIGDMNGGVHFYRNVSTGPVAEFQLVQPNITHSTGAVLDVGQGSTPQLFDLDGDGLLDLVIGELNGNLNHYRNTGSAEMPVWTWVTDTLGWVDTRLPGYNIGRSVPRLYRNADGETECIVGSESGWLKLYRQIDGNLDGVWELADDRFLGVRDGDRSAVALHDLTGDGRLEMVMGNHRGGLSFWRGGSNLSAGDQGANAAPFHIYPNPAKDQVFLELEQDPAEGSRWIMYDAIGQEVLQLRPTGRRTELSLHDRAAGIYHIRFLGAQAMPALPLILTPVAGH